MFHRGDTRGIPILAPIDLHPGSILRKEAAGGRGRGRDRGTGGAGDHLT